MATDPLDALRLLPTPMAPSPAFAAELRRRLEASGGPPPAPGAARSATTPTRGGPVPTPTYVPERLAAVTPYLMVSDARAAVAYYEEVFGARVVYDPIVMDDGRVGHVEIEISGSVLMMADEFPEMGLLSPLSRGGTTVSLVVYVPDVDATYARAVDLGATGERPPADQFHGSRSGSLVDPFGHRWTISTPLTS